ncbi:TniQ family protein [Kitasatospora sp. NPDC092286]|uniref:TniQ family protein n=1 Tax=Kitasatospora sp. NPDC092286 TaxID=3364087 RepID=UPI00380D388D
MKAWTTGSLPIFVAPLPGEALDSWLEAYARRLRVTTHALLSFIGLLGSRPGRMTQRLTERERTVLQLATGLDRQALTAMTLEPFDGLTVTLDRNRRSTMRRPPHWPAFGANSRYCPRCFAENGGRWLLAWRQPWSFACPSHHCLLVERCPACRSTVRATGTRVGGPSRPGLCTRGEHQQQGVHRPRVACGFPLVEAPIQDLPPHGLVLTTQGHLDTILSAAPHQPAQARAQLGDLYALGWRAVYALKHDLQPPDVVHRVLAEAGGLQPAPETRRGTVSVHSIAVGTTLACLAAPHPLPEDPLLLDWLLPIGLVGHQQGIDKLAHSWKSTSPGLAGRALRPLDPTLRQKSRFRYGTANPNPFWRELAPEEVSRRVTSLPAKLWPSWTMRLLGPELTSAVTADTFRSAASPLLLLPGTRLDYSPAAGLLGIDHPQASGVPLGSSNVLQHCDPTLLSATIAQLAWALDRFGSPIDYQRRRQTFRPHTITWSEKEWERTLAQIGRPPRGPDPADLIRWQLLALLHGADPPTAKSKITELRRARATAPTALQDFIHRQAQALLDAASINEPLAWEPPLSWAPSSTWPGIDPDTIDEPRVISLIDHGYSEDQIATHLQLPLTQFRLYTESRGLTVPPPRSTGASRTRKRPARPRSRERGKGIPRTGPLSPEQLRHHYLERKMTQAQIAELAGCSTSTVGHALREAGIPPRQRRPDGELREATPRAWLADQYLTRGRSTPDIARELGVRKGAVMKLLRQYDIPTHPVGAYSNPFAALDIALSPAMQAVSRTLNCLPRLRALVIIPGHKNLTAAAAVVGGSSGTLGYQLRGLEKAAGFTIIERTSPLTPTAAGHAFLTEARDLLKHL